VYASVAPLLEELLEEGAVFCEVHAEVEEDASTLVLDV